MSRLKAVQQGTNAELIATAQALYPMNGLTLDLTPGDELGFWRDFKPDSLTLLEHGLDFRDTGMIGKFYDDIAFDPPYVTKGGHKTSTIKKMNQRYGMLHVEKSPQLQWDLQIVPGVREARRLLKRRGRLWLKCMDYVTSGKVWWFTKDALEMLRAEGFKLEDEFILDGNPGPQPLFDKCKPCQGAGDVPGPSGVAVNCPTCEGAGKVPRRQVHAARAHSVLMIAIKR